MRLWRNCWRASQPEHRMLTIPITSNISPTIRLVESSENVITITVTIEMIAIANSKIKTGKYFFDISSIAFDV